MSPLSAAQYEALNHVITSIENEVLSFTCDDLDQGGGAAAAVDVDTNTGQTTQGGRRNSATLRVPKRQKVRVPTRQRQGASSGSNQGASNGQGSTEKQRVAAPVAVVQNNNVGSGADDTC
jgi:hypothetical protein